MTRGIESETFFKALDSETNERYNIFLRLYFLSVFLFFSVHSVSRKNHLDYYSILDFSIGCVKNKHQHQQQQSFEEMRGWETYKTQNEPKKKRKNKLKILSKRQNGKQKRIFLNIENHKIQISSLF